jgi:hypothetical protein
MRRVRWLVDFRVRGRGKCIVALGDKWLHALSPLSTFQMALSAPARFVGGVESEGTSGKIRWRSGSTLQRAAGFCSSSEQSYESERVRCEEKCVRDRVRLSLMWWLCLVNFEKAVFSSGHAKASGLHLALIDGCEGRASEWWPDHEQNPPRKGCVMSNQRRVL